ncbi:5'-nucleotidase C-terminal domain-containing protein [Nocardioides sp.]|uniref:5'-nucleotidase C-terminal domain-containing protein n=1 Tax=Nocardioides sp. TaxID=35761 RepID=UPI00272487A9|nr:5'-nucleotidase C-terminal domain-containing protein [Nocardioides sp.]MDO9455348.1 5'-nucleotidase C-terminal domain-containing protein [Nocardioides sp.]
MSRLSPARLVAAVCLTVGIAGVGAVPAQAAPAPTAPTAVGDDVIAFVEVEDGAISGGAAGPPAFNSGDHSNFSGTGSYTFRETGMTSAMTVTAPAAGVYPVWVRYAAGPLGADENVTRSMGLLTNGGARQVLSYPMTSLENWEAWRFVKTTATLNQGANTLALQCDRGTDFCRLNFDAVQVGGTAPDTCAATPPESGYTRLYDGTFESFDGWRKAGAGGFGRQSDCTIRSTRGRGAEWFTTQQTTPSTLKLDWRRNDNNDDSAVYVASSSRNGADPVGGFAVPIGADTGAIVPTGGTAKAPDAAAVAAAVRPFGQWNTYTITLSGTQVRVLLNGTLVNSFTSPTAIPASGFVGLENRGFLDTVDFRNIQAKPSVAAATREIQVLGTNDFHGRLQADGAQAGAAVLSGAVKQLRAQNPDTVFAAAGDLIGGSTFASYVQQDDPTIDALNEAGLDVSAVGSHELDRGYPDLAGRVTARADWDYVAANLRQRSDGSRALAASWTKTFGEVEVGFVGAVTEQLPSLVPAAGIADVTVTDVVDEVNTAADALEAAGADVIVLLVHEGAVTTDVASATDGSTFGQIVTGVDSNVDAIISGHTHLAYNHAIPVPAWVAQGRAVTRRPVVSAGRNGTHLNRLTFTVDTTTGAVTAGTQTVLPLVATPAYPADAATQAVVDAAVAQAEVLGAAELGTLAGPVSRARLANGTDESLGGESTLGNLVAEAQRWATRAPESGGAQIAFVDPDDLGDDLLGNPGGYPATLTYGQAARVQPAAEPLVTMRLTGTQIKTVLEQQWQRTAAGTVPARPFLRLGTSAGFRYTYDPTRAEGARVTGMWLDDVAIVPATRYSVTASSALAAGGDNFRAFTTGSGARDTGKVDLAALLDHLRAVADTTAGGSPITADAEQHSVGVAFPAGAPASYVAGGAFDVDLTSLAFSAPTDPKDTSVLVSLGDRPLGSFPVDNTVGADASDEHGRAAVRATLPADTAAGPATVTIVGNVTGTTVALPITVTQAPVPIRADSAAAVTAPTSVTVRQGIAIVSVAVASPGGTPAGDVEIWVDGARRSTVALVGGRAQAAVGPFDTAGRKTVQVRYLGNATTKPSTSAVTITVAKAAPRLGVTVLPGTVIAHRTRTRLAVTVTAPRTAPTGRVTVRVGQKTYAGTLEAGKVTVTLPRFARPGTVRAVVTYVGDARTRSASTSVPITVRARR